MADLCRGICLRRVDYGEHDAVVTFLTDTAGKVACLAKGVRRPRSKTAVVCQIFAEARLQLVPGQRLARLAQVELLESHYALREDVWRSAYATYCVELVDRALPEQEAQPEVYALLAETLAGLAAAEEGEALVHSFELRLLALLGYEPVLDRCARSGEPLGEEVVFCPSAGGLLNFEQCDPREAAVPVTPPVVNALRRLLDPGRYGLDLTRTRVPEKLVGPLRAALRAHIACHLETEPKSARFIDQLRALEGR